MLQFRLSDDVFDYKVWAAYQRAQLKKEKLWAANVTDRPAAASDDKNSDPVVEAWDAMNEAALATIQRSVKPVHLLTVTSVDTRGCHGYIPEDYIRALYPYPLRIRAGDAYPKCIMRKGGEHVSILSDRNCEIISDPYPRYESQDTGIYTAMRLPAPGEFWLNTVDLSIRVPTIGGLMSEHLAATSGDPARPGWKRPITRLDPIAWLSECNTRFRTVILPSV